MPGLVQLIDGEPRLTFPITAAVTKVGTGGLNDLVVHDPKVARHHLFVIQEGTVWKVLDKTGKGLTVNGARVTERELCDGALIGFGDDDRAFLYRPFTAPPVFPLK